MKILIAYYSRTGCTEKVAQSLKKNLEESGHSVDVERVKPVKEHSFLYWWHLRIIKGECDIQEPVIQDVSEYDAVLIGSPNWTRLSLPMARYLKTIKGLKYKKIGFFATTILWPTFEWFVFSAYLLDFTFNRIIEKQKGRIVYSILLSSFFKRWDFNSDYGKKEIKEFCDKIEAPIVFSKNFVLEQKERENTRLLVVLFSLFLVVSLLFQIISSAIGWQIFSWSQFLSLFIISLIAYFAIMVIMISKAEVFWGKYLAGVFSVTVWSLIIFFLTPDLGRIIILGYILILMFISFFQDSNAVIATGAAAIFVYSILFFSYPFKIFHPEIDIPIIALTTTMLVLITRNLQKNFLDLLELQEDVEESRAILEIRVRARTRELRELAESLDRQVKEKTKSLQEKIEELEKFNRLAVGRELKMIELKEEIKKLKEEVEKHKKGQ